MNAKNIKLMNSTKEKTPFTTAGDKKTIDLFDKKDSLIGKPIIGMNFMGHGPYTEDFDKFFSYSF